MKPLKLNLSVYQGKTFTQVVRWGQAGRTWKPITSVTAAAPAVLTVANHGLTVGWPFYIDGAKGGSGIAALNSVNHGVYSAVVPTTSTVELNDVNGLGLGALTAGSIYYHPPVDLTGFTAKLQVRAATTDATPLVDLNTSNGGVLLDLSAHTITIVMTAVQTAAFAWASGSYDLELLDASGTVYPVATGAVSVTPSWIE